MTGSRLLKYASAEPGDLRFNQQHQLAASHALKIYKSGAVYTFIPKNGCSTMRLSVAIANCCIADASGINWIHENNDTFRANLEDLVRATYTFVILRDPFARLASCFLDKIVSHARPARQLKKLVGRDLNLDEITFSDFVNYLDSTSVRSGNMHWRPQTEFLVYDRYDDYFAVEDFATVATAIRDRAGLELIDARPLTAHGLDRYRLLSPSIDHSSTPVREIVRLMCDGDCPDPRSLFTPPIAELVAHLYANDIRLYAEKIGRSTLFPMMASAAI
jgi:hypothetical protein